MATKTKLSPKMLKKYAVLYLKKYGSPESTWDFEFLLDEAWDKREYNHLTSEQRANADDYRRTVARKFGQISRDAVDAKKHDISIPKIINSALTKADYALGTMMDIPGNIRGNLIVRRRHIWHDWFLYNAEEYYGFIPKSKALHDIFTWMNPNGEEAHIGSDNYPDPVKDLKQAYRDAERMPYQWLQADDDNGDGDYQVGKPTDFGNLTELLDIFTDDFLKDDSKTLKLR